MVVELPDFTTIGQGVVQRSMASFSVSNDTWFARMVVMRSQRDQTQPPVPNGANSPRVRDLSSVSSEQVRDAIEHLLKLVDQRLPERFYAQEPMWRKALAGLVARIAGISTSIAKLAEPEHVPKGPVTASAGRAPFIWAPAQRHHPRQVEALARRRWRRALRSGGRLSRGRFGGRCVVGQRDHLRPAAVLDGVAGSQPGRWGAPPAFNGSRPRRPGTCPGRGRQPRVEPGSGAGGRPAPRTGRRCRRASGRPDRRSRPTR